MYPPPRRRGGRNIVIVTVEACAQLLFRGPGDDGGRPKRHVRLPFAVRRRVFNFAKNKKNQPPKTHKTHRLAVMSSAL